MSVRPLIMDWEVPGLVGTISFVVKDNTGAVVIPSTTENIIEDSPGIYITFVDAGLSGYITWSDGVDYEIEHFVALDLLSPISSPIGAPLTSAYQNPASIDSYALTKPWTDDWYNLSYSEKLKLAYEATRLIDALNFQYSKTDPAQLLEFPRNGETVVPNDVLVAHAEIAIELSVLGRDWRREGNSGVLSERFAAVGITYDPNQLPIWWRAGIPSEYAWSLLYKYLVRAADTVNLRRVN